MSIAAREFVFLDTQIFVAVAFNFHGGALKTMKEHFAEDRLQLVITDITIHEVKARIRKKLTAELIHLKKFQKGAASSRFVSLPAMNAVLQKIDVEASVSDLVGQFDSYLKEAHVVTLTTELALAPEVFDKYFKEEPPFETKEAKKFEFPDAFVINILSRWSQDTGNEMFVVSGDKGMGEACKSVQQLKHLEHVSNLLDHVASDDDRAKFVRSEVADRISEIRENIAADFENYDFWVDDDYGEAIVKITDIQADDEPEILKFNAHTAKVQITFQASFDAELTYDDPNSGIWDSEEKQMLFVEQREETVERDVELIAVVDVSFEGDDSQMFSIDAIQLVSPEEGYGIETDESSMTFR